MTGYGISALRGYGWAAALLLVWVALVFWPPLSGRAQDGGTPNVPLVKATRLAVEPDGRSRIVLDFDHAPGGIVQHRWFTLSNPARVVVDFPAVQFITQPSLIDIPDNKLLKGMRAGLFRPGTVRMVVDLAGPARVSVFALPSGQSKGPRLVMDFAPPLPGQKPTDVAPPPDVVTSVPWSPAGGMQPVAQPENQTTEQAAPVVPPRVVRTPGGPLVVTLDAGHGGVDPGACARGVCEKQLTLDMARRVGELLKKENIDVVYTREGDEYIPLGERSRIAERAQANLFVSLHADSHPDRDVRGATVYMVSERASDKEAARLAESENAGDVLAGVGFENESREVQGILLSLVQRDTLNNSSYLARSVLDQLKGVTEVRKPDPLFAGFKVLKAPDVPSILVEMGYITNASERGNFGSRAYKEKLSGAIAEGIRHYLRNYVHLQGALSAEAAEAGAVPQAAKKRRRHTR